MTDKKTYRALIFDWDGTLADSTAQITEAICRAFAAAGLPVPTRAQASHVIGVNLDTALQFLGHAADDGQKRQLAANYRRLYAQTHTQLFAGALTLLEQCHTRYLLGVATGKSRAGLERALDETATRRLFAATRTADECASKPAPDMVLSLCGEWDLPPEEVLVIGDTTHDLLAAHYAGADAAAVTTGAHPRAQLAGVPNIGIFDSLREALAVLES